MYCLRAQTGHRKTAFGGSSPTPDSGAKANKVIGRFTWKAESLLGRKKGLGHIVTPNPTDRAQSSLTRFADAITRRKAVLQDSHLRSTQPKGSDRGEHKASRTTGRSHEGTRTACRGRNQRAPLRNLPTKACDPTDQPSTKACQAERWPQHTPLK